MKKKHKQIMVHIGAHTFLIIASIIAIFPILWIFSTSIRASNTMFSSSLDIIPKDITFDNYRKIFSEEGLLIWFRNSIIIASVTTIFSIAFGLLGGYAFSRFRFKGRKLGMNMLLLLNAFPNILAMVALYRLFSLLKLINNPIGLILIYTSWQLVFAIWNLKGFLDTIPKELEEAACIDGAGTFAMLFKIILPLSKPAIAVTALFAFLGSWNEYIFGLTFITDKNLYTLPMGLYTIQSQAGQYATNWSLFAAGSLIVAIPIALLFLFLQKFLISGLTAGGVKG